MTIQAFTRNYRDNSSQSGFQFTFYCDICNDGFKTQFIPSESNKKAGFLKGIGKAVSIGADIVGQGRFGYSVERGTSVLGTRFEGMSPEWRKEHEAAFKIAQDEAKQIFKRCPKCRLYVCKNDWNEQDGLCVKCAPKAIEAKQTICPQCGKPSGGGKFCSNCGASLAPNKCSNCGADNKVGAKFCSECGNKLN